MSSHFLNFLFLLLSFCKGTGSVFVRSLLDHRSNLLVTSREYTADLRHPIYSPQSKPILTIHEAKQRKGIMCLSTIRSFSLWSLFFFFSGPLSCFLFLFFFCLPNCSKKCSFKTVSLFHGTVCTNKSNFIIMFFIYKPCMCVYACASACSGAALEK